MGKGPEQTFLKRRNTNSQHVYLKLLEISQVWWFTSVIPALWEAKAGRSPEVRSL